MISEQWLPVNNSHYFGVSRVVVVHNFDSNFKLYKIFQNVNANTEEYNVAQMTRNHGAQKQEASPTVLATLV
jgi:hypothetical protein